MPSDAARLVLPGFRHWPASAIGLDGFAARKLKAGSDFGRMLDPIADKVLIAVALIAVGGGRHVPQRQS